MLIQSVSEVRAQSYKSCNQLSFYSLSMLEKDRMNASDRLLSRIPSLQASKLLPTSEVNAIMGHTSTIPMELLLTAITTERQQVGTHKRQSNCWGNPALCEFHAPLAR
jgi:hypothetical protein